MRCLRVFLIGILLLGAFSLNSISSATDWDYIGKNSQRYDAFYR